MVKKFLVVAVLVTWRVVKWVDCPPRLVEDPWTGVKLQEYEVEYSTRNVGYYVIDWPQRKQCRETVGYRYIEKPTREAAIEFIKTKPDNVDSIRIDGRLYRETE